MGAHFALTVLHGKPLTIYGDGNQVRDLLFIEDLLELMLRCVRGIDRCAGQVYNVGGGPSHIISVLAELRDLLRQQTGKLPTVEYRKFSPDDQRVYISDIRIAQRDLDWHPCVGVSDGLRRMIAQWDPDRLPTPRPLQAGGEHSA